MIRASIRKIQTLSIAILVAFVFSMAAGLEVAAAKSDDENRSKHSGVIQARPDSGLHGMWVIGDRTFETGAGTEFDQSDGPLNVGACASVKLRNGRVHEIDSEPMSDCR